LKSGWYGKHKGSAFITGSFIFQLDQDEPAQVGKDQEIKALSEMDELLQFENDLWSPKSE